MKVMYWILDDCDNVLEECSTLSEARELFEWYSKHQGYRIEKARNFYEVSLMECVGGRKDDFETKDYISAENYREAVRIAKERSNKWDACDVICYTKSQDTSYDVVYREQYIKGKKQFRWSVQFEF